MLICPECSTDVESPAGRSTHPRMINGGFLCGVSGRAAGSERIVPATSAPGKTDADRVAQARGALDDIALIVEFHVREHGVPPEIDTPRGWTDLPTLLQRLDGALS